MFIEKVAYFVASFVFSIKLNLIDCMNKLVSNVIFIIFCSTFSIISFGSFAQTASDIEAAKQESKKNELSARQKQELKNPNRTPLTAVIGAMQVEVDLFKLKVHPKRDTVIMGITFTVGKMRTRDVVVVKSGIGKVNSAMTAALLLEHFDPSEVVFTGIAGGIDPLLLPGDIVVGERAAQHDFGQLTTEGIIVWQTFDYDETFESVIFSLRFFAYKKDTRSRRKSKNKIYKNLRCQTQANYKHRHNRYWRCFCGFYAIQKSFGKRV